MIVGPGSRRDLHQDGQPKEVGADRIVNAVAVFAKHHKPPSSSTSERPPPSTTCPRRGIHGRRDRPGVNISAEPSSGRPRASRIEIVSPPRSSEEHGAAMQSGSSTGMSRWSRDHRPDPEGVRLDPCDRHRGLARTIAAETTKIHGIDENLTLEGCVLYTRGTFPDPWKPRSAEHTPFRRTVRGTSRDPERGIIAHGGAERRRWQRPFCSTRRHGPDGKGGRRKLQLRLRPEEIRRRSRSAPPSITTSGQGRGHARRHPGYINFEADTVLPQVLDGAILVVNAVSGVEVQTEKMWNLARGPTCR